MAKLRLDDKSVRAIASPASGNRIDYDVPHGVRDSGFVRGFALRTTAAGTKTFLLVYVTREGRERRHKIGDFGPFTVTTARDAARQLRLQVESGTDPFADQAARRRAATARRVRDNATLGGLLSAYVGVLRRSKRPSAGRVEAEIKRTVELAHPALWRKAVGDVTLDDLVKITGRLVKAGTWRQAEKTRAYLRAAYAAAVAARGKPDIADLFEGYEHVVNVARDLGVIVRPVASRAHGEQPAPTKRALSEAELASYWQRIEKVKGAHGALLRFHLLTGAQRAEQLARLQRRDWDVDAGVVTLWDSKGRRASPRAHLIPLLPGAKSALEAMRGEKGEFLFSLDGGKCGAGYHTLRSLVLEVARQMVEAEETASTFTPGELRITVETRLAALKVSKAARAHLQSHGLGGVQDKHYDRHDYLAEKRAALDALWRLVNRNTTQVTPIARRRKAS